MPVTVYTIGHSNRATAEFIELLRKNGVTRLVDIRLIPKSRANPQFGQGRLKRALGKAGIEYMHEPRMGGRRRAANNSINTGWRNASFRGYADHMATPDFKDALKELVEHGRAETTAIMCAEAVPWRCHRTLVADALKSKRCRVFHIIGGSTPSEHKYTPFLKIERGVLTYPP